MAVRSKEIVYANISTGYEKGRAYANPRFFITPRTDVTKVIVVGDWPKVVDAYQKAGVPVVQLQPGQPLEEADSADPLPFGEGVSLKPKTNSEGDPHDPGKVEIPEDWADFSWPALRTLAKEIDGKKFPIKKDEAIEIIEKELERRKLPPQL